MWEIPLMRNWLVRTQITKDISEAIVTLNHIAENDIICNNFKIQKENNFKNSEERL